MKREDEGERNIERENDGTKRKKEKEKEIVSRHFHFNNRKEVILPNIF